MWQKHIVVWTVLTVIDAFTAGWYYLFCCADTLLSCCNGTYSPSVCSFDTQAEACDAYSDGVKKLIWFLVSAGALWGSIFIEILVRRCLTPQIVDRQQKNLERLFINFKQEANLLIVQLEKVCNSSQPSSSLSSEEIDVIKQIIDEIKEVCSLLDFGQIHRMTA